MSVRPTAGVRPTESVERSNRRAPGLRLRRWAAAPEVGVGAALVILFLLFSALEPTRFPTVDNTRNLAADASTLIVLAMATTFVVVSGSLDLSIGSVIVFCEVASVKVMGSIGGAGLDVAAAGLAVAVLGGGAWGMLNGTLVTRLRIPAFVATLATLGIALGAGQVLSDGTDLATVPTDLVTDVGIGNIASIPVLFVLALAVVVGAAVTLRTTRFGRNCYAVGSDDQAAARAGVDVRRHLLRVHALAGSLYGLAAFLGVARFSTTNIGGHQTDALDAITAVALGGGSLFGGVGTALGSLIGVFIPSILDNGLVVVGVPSYWQQIGVGVALIGALYLDQLRRGRKRRG